MIGSCTPPSFWIPPITFTQYFVRGSLSFWEVKLCMSNDLCFPHPPHIHTHTTFAYTWFFFGCKQISWKNLAICWSPGLETQEYRNKEKNITYHCCCWFHFITHNGAFTLDVKLVLNENLGGILGGNPMLNGQ
jgi:hypothetical protein